MAEITIKEAAKRYGIPERTIRSWCVTGKVPSRRDSPRGQFRFTEEALTRISATYSKHHSALTTGDTAAMGLREQKLAAEVARLNQQIAANREAILMEAWEDTCQDLDWMLEPLKDAIESCALSNEQKAKLGAALTQCAERALTASGR